MTRALVIYCHPREGSYTSAVRDVVLERLAFSGAEVRLRDLYGADFAPVLTAGEFETYADAATNRAPVERDVDDVLWCDTLIFVYPTWWYGMPAMLKGWLDRVLLPDVAFKLPNSQSQKIRPGLTHITRLGVFTTCGASWWVTHLIGSPGRRTLLRGVRAICARRCKTTFAAHYRMDASTNATRSTHLREVARKMDRFMGTGQSEPREAEI
ncbi:NAD(P)H-dependent oxidoreductase [uncultured Roseobacter sp.]|uniref:NAD(P)H-dependent oxidoreductase n=1 Tax=uncultured Roseobacter sp. TaxID=114847 RepID=UPI00260BD0EC|nr:NAD(P)H-dependent oxidoreductase [uncultured Roseobacter sp.]